MPRKPIRARKILELLSRGESARSISKKKGYAQKSVKEVRTAAERLGVTWEDVRDMTDAEAYALLFPDRADAAGGIAEPDYEYVHSELMRDGVTLKTLWTEYRDRAAQDGTGSVCYQTFCKNYKGYVGSRNVVSHIERKPGQAMEVDWAGSTVPLVDRFTGEATKAYLFVATLPYSQFSYAEATHDMKMRSWVMCHVHAWDYIGGVAVRTVPDNLKTGVTRHPKEGEIVLNPQYEALGEHYSTAIMPAGVRKPTHKASAESTVGDIERAVVGGLRDRTFHTIEDLNAAILEVLEEYNSRPFRKREGNRRQLLEDVEAAFLTPLPACAYEYCEWAYGRKVQKNFHIQFEKNYYSVPSRLVGRVVDVRFGDNVVEVFHEGERVATHVRFAPGVQWQYRTDKAHMPEGSEPVEWDDARLKRWAASIGPNALGVVTRLIDSVPVKEQAYNPCLAVLNLTKRYGNERVEDACAYCLARHNAPRHAFIRSVIASRVAEGHAGAEARRELEERKSEGTSLRGARYYGNGGGAL